MCLLYIRRGITDGNPAMRRATICFLMVSLLSGAFSRARAAGQADPAAAPDFQEVYTLIRSHLAGIDAEELNRTAVIALVTALGPRVSLLSSQQPDSIEISGGPLVKKSVLFDGAIAYLQLGRVGEGLAGTLRQAYDKFATNSLNGVVLDLRFAGGNDYAAAAQAADLFVSKEMPLLDWGQGLMRSKEKTNAISVPVVVLINRETARSAEALAAVLRETGAALLIGNRTAGQAMMTHDYALKNGDTLRIAAEPIRLGEGVPLSAQGIKPDLMVDVTPEDERVYLADPFKVLPGSSGATMSGSATNRIRRPRFNEADLVRERREGFAPELDDSPQSESEPEKPVVRDPALARGLDVLKGLAVVRRSQS
jgi:hypothetical protein